MEDINVSEVEESIESKIEGLQDQINQLNKMIEENRRLISEGDDVTGREYLLSHLIESVNNSEIELNDLRNQL